MKAITIHQPWAWFIATGQKKYETRSWATKYRGPLAIHAGRSRAYLDVLNFMDFDTPPVIRHFGAIIAVVQLEACLTTEYVSEWCENDIADELDMGDFTPGRWAWELTEVTEVDMPIYTKGHQGLWEYRGDLL